MEKVVNEAIDDAMHEAEALLVARLGEASLSELAERFELRCNQSCAARKR